MIIGFDFDNTIVCYDNAIRVLAESIPQLTGDTPRDKAGLKDFFHKNGREHEWTEFQGKLYGPGMNYARAFPRVKDVILSLKKEGHSLLIISHRSRYPYAGHKYDLHQHAWEWLRNHIQNMRGLDGEEAFIGINFLETKEDKIRLIRELGCDVFVDDLPEILTARGFPDTTKGILFGKGEDRLSKRWEGMQAEDWRTIKEYIDRVNHER